MRKLTWMIFGLFAAVASAAHASDGITPSAEQLQWSRWQGRMAVGTEPAGLKLNTVSLMGDYYFTGSLLGPRRAGGFRATSGLLLGPRTQSWLGQPGVNAGSSFSITAQVLGPAATLPAAGETPGDNATLPYLGLGYTGLSLRGGWSFNADLGLVARSPGNVVKFGRNQSLDDTARELRLSPLLQFGVSYSF
ncbi:MAG: hypothetical protein Q8R33_01960 [Burkholderiales bacterium]|nr:hypothetical protein [Burkholderiales bacterium]